MLSAVILSLALASSASAACSRATLQAVADAYLDAQGAGKPDELPLSEGVSYLENDVETDVAKGVLATAMKIEYNYTIVDTTACAAFAELVAGTATEHPYMIHTRMLLDEGGDGIATLQSVVADPGDWVFNATASLYWATREAATWRTPIAGPARDSRETLRAAADAYLDSWTDPAVQGHVPYGTPCARLEGGLYTGASAPANNTCVMPLFPANFTVTNRRYVVDEELGAVSIFNDFPFIDTTRPDGAPSANLFKIEGGMIRYIHEVTVCATKNCGR